MPTHTGAEYESGAANAARGQNDADAERLLPDGERIDPAGVQSPPQRRTGGAGAKSPTRGSLDSRCSVRTRCNA